MADEPILELEDVSKSFGGIRAVDKLSIELENGAITGLIGPNGAGKTTTFNLINGFYRPDGGTIRFRGRDLQEIMEPGADERQIWSSASAFVFAGAATAGGNMAGLGTPEGVGLAALGAVVGVGVYYGQDLVRDRFVEYPNSRPHRVAREGLSRTFQLTRELGSVTVLENLMLAPQGQLGERLYNVWLRPGSVRDQERELRERAQEMLDLLEIDHLKYEAADNLSGGQRKLLELGRVLMTDPDLVLLDEPAAGVNPTLTNKLLERIQTLSDRGYTFCIIEHDMEVIMNLSDRIVVMDQGQKLMEGTPSEVKADERVIDAYLGG